MSTEHDLYPVLYHDGLTQRCMDLSVSSSVEEERQCIVLVQTAGFFSPDLVASFHADPLRDRPVLLLLLGQEAFNPESLV